MTLTIQTQVNGRGVTLEVDGDELLCDALRERLGLTGTKVACREGVCGSCDVIVDGEVVRSCLALAAQVDGAAVRTVEGLGDGRLLSALQQAFVEHGAAQCGYCTPGMLVNATALLERHPDAGDAEIVAALAGNLCRCTGYVKIVDAVRAVRRDELDEVTR